MPDLTLTLSLSPIQYAALSQIHTGSGTLESLEAFAARLACKTLLSQIEEAIARALTDNFTTVRDEFLKLDPEARATVLDALGLEQVGLNVRPKD